MLKNLPSYVLLASVSLLFVFGLLMGYDLYQSYQEEAAYTRLHGDLTAYRNHVILLIGLAGTGLLTFRYWTYSRNRIGLLIYVTLLLAVIVTAVLAPEKSMF